MTFLLEMDRSTVLQVLRLTVRQQLSEVRSPILGSAPGRVHIKLRMASGPSVHSAKTRKIEDFCHALLCNFPLQLVSPSPGYAYDLRGENARTPVPSPEESGMYLTMYNEYFAPCLTPVKNDGGL